MTILICPGVHSPSLTTDFLQGLGGLPASTLVFPADRHPPYDPHALRRFLQQSSIDRAVPLTLIAFSAGVVAAMALAHQGLQPGPPINGLIALDGWGVPYVGAFPLHRLSHDRFTHWTGAMVGKGGEGFYADPAVDHLTLWRSPQTVTGWWMRSSALPGLSLLPSSGLKTATTAAQFILALLHHYGEEVCPTPG